MTASKLHRLPIAICLLITATIVCSNGAELLGYYAFEDNYDDSSGNGNDAQESQNPDQLSFTQGLRGKGLDINDPTVGGAANNNSGGSIDIPIDANADVLPAVSFGGWVKVDDETFGEFDGFMATDNGGWDRGITVNEGGTGAFGVASGEGPTVAGEVTPGEWRYVVGTFDIDSGISTVYVGNADATTQTTESNVGNDLAQIGEPVIEVGRYDNQDLDGVVDDLFVFDGALDAHQVNAIRNLRLSTADLSPLHVNQIFLLFEDGEEGPVNGALWKPVSGLPDDNPGVLVDMGDAGVAVVLDDSGNGMLGERAAFIPKEGDSDGDGMNDDWERTFFGSLDRDGTGDFDEDGVTDLAEFDGELLPDNKDTDGDGLEDGAEITATSNPKLKDTDGDGLEDGPEVATYKTSPVKADTDGDTFSDKVEVESKTDPLDINDKPVPAAFGLIAYYEFEDDYFDVSQNGNTAVPSFNPDELTFAPGFRGQGVDINDPTPDNNSGGSVDIPVDANPSALPGVTFGGWLKVDEETFGEFDGFMATDNGGWDRGITVNEGGTGAFGVASGAGPVVAGEVTPGQWQFVVGTFDNDAGIANVYVGNDLPAIQTTESAEGQDITIQGEPVIEIGRYDNQDLDALVDDVFVFDSALDAHHVNAIRNLRLSAVNYTPRQVAELFQLFEAGASGTVGNADWAPTTGLSASNPGALVKIGDTGVAVVLDDSGKGMLAPASAFSTTDSDGDGLDDLWETVNFGNLDQNAEDDPDGDSLNNAGEFDAGTRPTIKDTDGDGLEDGAEVTTHMTSPVKADSDEDGADDAREIAAGTDPNDPASVPKDAAPPLLALFEFEDEFADSSGNDNTARAEQNPDEISFVAGFRGLSADINDPDDAPNTGGSFNIPVDANPSSLPDVSFGGWINVAEDNFEFDGFMAVDNGGWDRGISVNAEASAAFGVASGAAPVSSGEIKNGEWQYVVATFSDDEDRAILYVGSADSASQTTETAEAQDLATEGEVEIEVGRYDNQDLDGMVDDIFVFGGELTPHQANAIRNLRLSPLDYSPAEAAQVFELFSNDASGAVGAYGWNPVSGLDATAPGAVIDFGGAFAVVLDNAGNGMLTGSAQVFQIKTIEITSNATTRSVTLTWNSQNNRVYALEAAADLDAWLEVDDGIDSEGSETSYTETSAALLGETVRYYRVREVR
ncbi:MAG: laminin G domain-containing protein [Verrucomicrobiae bacterium]|nr:laminin G domain-containing protein [Verrucomicrobiae bacterium]